MERGLGRWIASGRQQPEYGLWAVELRATGEVIGAVLLAPLPGEGTAVEIGWHLNPDYWGAGYATEAGRGAIAVAFALDRVGPDRIDRRQANRTAPVLDTVHAVVDPDNIRSREVCRRLGMRHLGQTSQYYSLTLEHFDLARADVRAAEGGPV
jgi:RimJ/RimL family protein N-acetyltransferase